MAGKPQGDQSRTETIRVRVTPAGKTAAQQLADLTHGGDVSAYIRDLLGRESAKLRRIGP